MNKIFSKNKFFNLVCKIEFKVTNNRQMTKLERFIYYTDHAGKTMIFGDVFKSFGPEST